MIRRGASSSACRSSRDSITWNEFYGDVRRAAKSLISLGVEKAVFVVGNTKARANELRPQVDRLRREAGEKHRIASTARSEAVTVAQQLAEGDLTVKIDPKSTDETGRLLEALRDTVDRLRDTISEIQNSQW